MSEFRKLEKEQCNLQETARTGSRHLTHSLCISAPGSLPGIVCWFVWYFPAHRSSSQVSYPIHICVAKQCLMQLSARQKLI